MAPIRTALALLLILTAPAFAAETIITLDGEVPSGDETHFFLPFEVPAGTVEIEVRHDDLSDANILDWGLDDPNGFRGWGGGNSEPAIVGVDAASRSYVPGPIPVGQWEVVVGKAKVRELPARYAVQVILRSEPMLAAQTERRPYVAPTPLSAGPRWYAGDFHVHSRESGDARPAIDAVLDFAAGRGLDFVMLSEHNTTSQLTLYGAAQDGHPDVLLVPGAEFTTYAGHANIIGTTEWVDHRIGVRGATIAAAIAAVHAQGGLMSINHPLLDVGDLCIGCGWHHDVDPAQIDAVEIQTGLFPGLTYWEGLLAQGSRAAAVGGSDDHRGGQDLGPLDSPIGTPTTLVYADELSVAAILQAVRDKRTVVKLIGPSAPMIDSDLSGQRLGDTVFADRSTLHATVSGGAGTTLRVIKNGTVIEEVAVSGDPFEHAYEAAAPAAGEDRYRLEVGDATRLLTVTSYTWLQRAPEPTPTFTPIPTATATLPPACAGDCDGNRQVEINELILGVGIALGSTPVSACPSFDTDHSDGVEVSELIAAVNASLGSCP
ncbi:MAG: CehA/McbA family metallohydrolase [Deltaproteobacteria bacterium]|nr:CehA/McbA family metallohydrolase [Deltaproteobacteria bacterium]